MLLNGDDGGIDDGDGNNNDNNNNNRNNISDNDNNKMDSSRPVVRPSIKTCSLHPKKTQRNL